MSSAPFFAMMTSSDQEEVERWRHGAILDDAIEFKLIELTLTSIRRNATRWIRIDSALSIDYMLIRSPKTKTGRLAGL